MSREAIYIKKIFDAEALLASGHEHSEALNMRSLVSEGFYEVSIQYEVTGDGEVDIEYELSHDGVSYISPLSASPIVEGVTKTTGTGSNGKDIVSFCPELSKYMKIKITEVGGAQAATVSMWIAIQ